jgi:hypothetical protein
MFAQLSTALLSGTTERNRQAASSDNMVVEVVSPSVPYNAFRKQTADYTSMGDSTCQARKQTGGD